MDRTGHVDKTGCVCTCVVVWLVIMEPVFVPHQYKDVQHRLYAWQQTIWDSRICDADNDDNDANVVTGLDIVVNSGLGKTHLLLRCVTCKAAPLPCRCRPGRYMLTALTVLLTSLVESQ